MSGTGEWSPGPLLDEVGLLGVRIGAWNHFRYPGDTPAAGEHTAEAIRAGHGAIEVIDQIIRDLHGLRGQLASGQLPPIRRIRRELAIGQDKAQQVQAHLSALIA